MQTPFITDLYATARPLTGVGVPNAALALRYLDQNGNQAGTSIVSAADLAEQARALLAVAEAAILCAANADGAPPMIHHHFPIMRDLRVADAA
ncbi:hypothetical protein ACVOMT_13510 [Sphingomonas panni]